MEEEEDGTMLERPCYISKIRATKEKKGTAPYRACDAELAARVSKLAFSLSRLQVSDYFLGTSVRAPFSFGFPPVSLSTRNICPREHFCTFESHRRVSLSSMLHPLPSNDLSDFFISPTII